MLRIEPRLAFINGVLLANRVLIFRFQLLAVYVLLVHNCGECRWKRVFRSATCFVWQSLTFALVLALLLTVNYLEITVHLSFEICHGSWKRISKEFQKEFQIPFPGQAASHVDAGGRDIFDFLKNCARHTDTIIYSFII
jgi:hypothetical protein